MMMHVLSIIVVLSQDNISYVFFSCVYTYVKPIVRVKCIDADVGITKSDVETVTELDEEKGAKKPISNVAEKEDRGIR